MIFKCFQGGGRVMAEEDEEWEWEEDEEDWEDEEEW